MQKSCSEQYAQLHFATLLHNCTIKLHDKIADVTLV